MQLLVLVENFGLNFSGGCIATAKFLETMQYAFDKVIILTQKIGFHKLEQVQFIIYEQSSEIPVLLDKCKSPNTIGYGDFYIAEYFINTGIPFFFTYHDNFPDVAKYNLFDVSFANQRMKYYQNIFEKAVHIFSVSKAKMPYIKQYTKRVTLVRNGVFQKIEKLKVSIPSSNEKINILMAGNVDYRKYRQAINLFSCLNIMADFNFQIDIYGLLNHENLSKELSGFSFVQLKGYIESIPFKDYHLYLNTSFAENLSIAVVDAIANHTPVITFDIGGLKEVINKNNGHAIPAFEVESMASQIIEMNYEHFAENFDNTTIENFDWEKNAKLMLDIMLSYF